MRNQLLLIICVLSLSARAQVVNTGMVDVYDTISKGKLTVGGLIDVYYLYDFNQPAGSERPYSVSSSRHNEINVNLAYVDLRYINDKVRAHLVSGFGTYVNANYANEPGSLKNLIEANVGVRLSRKKNIWLDAGVLPSPYTNESAVSKDHFMYTRSLAPEYVPYYLSGLKMSLPLSSKVNTYAYLLNGWQSIQDVNNPLSFGSQIEYRPNKKWLINWDTYIGDEYSVQHKDFGTRYFTDVYAIFNPEGRLGMTTCAYVGMQQVRDTTGKGSSELSNWFQYNIQFRYRLNKKMSLSMRTEYFYDGNGIMVKPVTNVKAFELFSGGLCFNLNVTDAALFRIEGRWFQSPDPMFNRYKSGAVKESLLLCTSLTAWF